MSQKIQVRRGTDANRTSVVFDAGEPLFTTDTEKFYVGDGSTAGGILIGPGASGGGGVGNIVSLNGLTGTLTIVGVSGAVVSTSGTSTIEIGTNLASITGLIGTGVYLPLSGNYYCLINSSTDQNVNGTNLLNLYNYLRVVASNFVANGTQFSILLTPGIYNIGSTSTSFLLNDAQNINLMGLTSNAPDVILTSNNTNGGTQGCTILVKSGYTTISNLSINGGSSKCFPIQITGTSAQYFNLYNVVLNQTGGGSSPSFATYPTTLVTYGDIGASISNCSFERVISNGTFFGTNGTQNGYPSSYVINVKNCQFYGANSFGNSTLTALKVENSTLTGNGVFAPQNASGVDNTSYVRGSYILAPGGGGGGFYSANFVGKTGYNGLIKGCIIYGNLYNFAGSVEDSYINSLGGTSAATKSPIYFQNSPSGLPRVTRCTLIASAGSPCVTGAAVVSGMINYCLLNSTIYTGFTGANTFNQFNIIDTAVSNL